MNKKIILIGLVFTMLSSMTFGQGFKFGGGLFVGFGGIKNQGQVQQLFDVLKSRSPEIDTYTLSNTNGTVFGLEGIVAYYINKKFSLNSGIQFQSQSNTLVLDYKEITGGNGSYDAIHSTGTIAFNTFSIPIIAKYSFMEEGVSPFVNFGFVFDSRLNPVLSSNETITEVNVSKPSNNKIEYRAFSNKQLEGLTPTALTYIIGGGLDYKTSSNNILSLGLYYNATLQNSSLYVRNIDSNNGSVSKLNKIYDLGTQQDFSSKYGYLLNDWKNSNLGLKLSFLF
jgi:hypothetical protein